MQRSKSILKGVMCLVVILVGFFVMALPIVKSISSSETSSLVFLGVILGFLFLPSIIYCIITVKKKEMEYTIIPAVFIVAVEYYFFHDYSTWIASDANAAIGLIIAPFYLMIVLGIAHGVAFVVLKIRSKIIR